MDARVVGRRDALEPLLLQVPVVDPADEGGDQGDAGLGAGDRLGEAEEQRQVAVDALFLEPLGGPDSLPGRGDLDQDPLAVDAVGLVEADQPARLLDRRLGVEREPGVDLGRDAAGDDLEDLLAEGDEQAIDAGLDLRVVIVALGLGRADDLLEQPAVSRHLRRLQQERRVRRGIAGLVLGDRLEVTAVGNDHGHLAQLVQEVHRSPLRMESKPPITQRVRLRFGRPSPCLSNIHSDQRPDSSTPPVPLGYLSRRSGRTGMCGTGDGGAAPGGVGNRPGDR